MRQILFSILLIWSSVIYAGDIKRPDSYNYTRGVEALNNGDVDEALEYMNKEVKDHPDNGYAFAVIAHLRLYTEEYGRALTASNIAVKKVPAKDKEYKSFAYHTRADIYLNLGDTIQALKDFSQAISFTPDETELYEERAQIYYEQNKYDLADKDYQKLIALDEGSVMGYMGLGRNANDQGRYVDAIKLFDYVNKLAPSYSSAYSFRAESYMGLKKYNEAIDDMITALGIDRDNKAFGLLEVLADSAFDQTVAKLKAQKIRDPHNGYWPFILGCVHEGAQKYPSAIAYYKEYMALDQNSMSDTGTAYCDSRIACSYAKMGNYAKALDYYNQAIALDSTDTNYLYFKANILNSLGRSAEAIETMSEYIALNPGESIPYHVRGLYKDLSGDIDGAIEDYTTSVFLYPQHAPSHQRRGELYLLKGDKNAADDDFEQVITIESELDRADCTRYAYFYLGDTEEATRLLKKALDDKEISYYDAACLYSLMGEKDNAIAFLRLHLENGYRDFYHIKRDRHLNNIRSSEEFASLLKEFEEKHQAEIAEADGGDEPEYEQKSAEIPFTQEGGICKVKCSVNNLPLHFVFDTGASDVSISSVEANFMLKNGYLSQSDLIGTQNFLTADGNISEGTIINLRDVKFGDLHLRGVKASIVNNQSAPLLLGQSVLSKLGNIEIDNNNKVLRVTYKQKVK